MANRENKYYQIGMGTDGADTEPFSTGRWMKAGIVGITLFCASCVALMLVGAHSTSEAARAAESTNLIGMSTYLRPSAGSMKPGVMNAMSSSPLQKLPVSAIEARLPGSSPFKKIAVSAFEAINRGNRMRDVSRAAKEELKEEISTSDDATKAEVAKMEETVAMKAKNMAGVTAPMDFFDPLGFTTDCTEGKLLFYREVELKHGRIGMLASLGFLVGEQFHPLFGGNIDVPSYVAFQQTPLQTFWPAVVLAIAIPEVFSVMTFVEPNNENDSLWAIKADGRLPGDLGFDPLGLKPTDPKELKELQTKELNNGRLAMIAAAGMIAQELATGQKLF